MKKSALVCIVEIMYFTTVLEKTTNQPFSPKEPTPTFRFEKTGYELRISKN